MSWALGLLFILILIWVRSSYSNKKKLINLKKKLHDNWGKPKNDSYFNFFVIGRYFENNQHKHQAYHIISDKIKTDLDIDDIFKFIDRTTSKIGQQYLYFKIRTIGNIEQLLKFNTLTQLFEKTKSLGISCQILLSKLNSNDVYYLEELINGKQIEKPKNIWFVYLLSSLAIILVILSIFYPGFLLLLFPVFIVNMFFHYKNKSNVTYYATGVSQLSTTLAVSEKFAQISEINHHFKDLSFIKKIKAIKAKTKFIEFEKILSNEFALVFWVFIEFIKILFNLEYLIFFSFIDAIAREQQNIEKMYCFIGEIDSAISTASLKSGNYNICEPQFTSEKNIITKGIYHPLIEQCIPNDLNLIENSMLLTGSNMSGKTTFIRTLALNSILAETLNICFAESYKTPYFKVFTSVRITDDLLDNTSYYLEEVLTIKELVEASKGKAPCLFVLDEIFKGTNTVERVSGGKAILSFLNRKNHIVLVSTHDIELTDLLKQDNFELYHFSELIEDDTIYFDHKLKKGKLKTRNAIKILELYDYPQEIINDARNTEHDNFERQ